MPFHAAGIMYGLTCHQLPIQQIQRLSVRSGISLLLGAMLLGIALQSPAAEPKKLAFVFGVSEYKKDGLTPLKYAVDDAKDLAK